MPRQLREVLADARADADVLDRRGHASEAESLRRLCTDVEDATREHLTMLPELDAALFSGQDPRTLQRKFPRLAERNLAERRGRLRYYCQAALDRRSDPQAAFNAGRKAAHAEGTAA